MGDTAGLDVRLGRLEPAGPGVGHSLVAKLSDEPGVAGDPFAGVLAPEADGELNPEAGEAGADPARAALAAFLAWMILLRFS